MRLSKMITAMGAVLTVVSGIGTSASASLRPSARSSFVEILAAIQLTAPSVGGGLFAQSDRSLYLGGSLPAYGFSLLSLVDGTMTAAASRTVTDKRDLRIYSPKLVHANGVCAVGEWNITTLSPYSGYFAQGSRGLFIGRISSATPQTTSDDERSFGFAGKIFPTLNPDEHVKTANFVTVDVLTGQLMPRFAMTELTNEPRFDIAHLGLAAAIGFRRLQRIFRAADPVETFRPLYPISRAGLAAGEVPRTPRWMKLRISPETANPNATDADFRNELSMARYPSGFAFDIFVSDQTKNVDDSANWARIGEIRVAQTMVSFGCDRRLNFAHARVEDPEAGR